MTSNTVASSGVWVLKWLGTPRAACAVIRAISMPSATAAAVAAPRASRAPLRTRVTIQATVSE
jgi:hypothetical protein